MYSYLSFYFWRVIIIKARAIIISLKKNLKMEFAKKLAIDLLIITAGVLIAFKIKEKMDKASLVAPKK